MSPIYGRVWASFDGLPNANLEYCGPRKVSLGKLPRTLDRNFTELCALVNDEPHLGLDDLRYGEF